MQWKYRVIRSARKTIAIQIVSGGEVVVRAPRLVSTAQIQRFVESKSHWIEKQLAKMPTVTKLTAAEIQKLVHAWLNKHDNEAPAHALSSCVPA